MYRINGLTQSIMYRKKIITLLCASLMSSGLTAADYAFNDTTLHDNVRIDKLMELLTLDEKVALLSTDLGVPRLGIPGCVQVEGLHGLSLSGPGKENPDTIPTTIFPQAYGLGHTWDRDLIRRIADHVATEARYYSQHDPDKMKILVMRAPNADLARDPRWGRTEESFGEDPYLTAEMTVAKIKGLQGDSPRYWKTAALMKHFLANSNEFGRDSSSSDFDSNLFRDYYSYPFYKGITEGGSRAFMAAYNSWNGTPMAMHPCLDSITRKEWGNDGIICTDGGALGLLVSAHKRFPTRAEGAAAIVKATTGQFLDRYSDEIAEALEKGILTEADIEKAIRGNIKVALKLGLLDGKNTGDPYLSIGRGETLPPFLTDSAKTLAREAAVKSIVLLKNASVSGNAAPAMLPIDIRKIRKIAVIGPYADLIIQDWYSGMPPYEVTILQGIKNAVKGTEIEVLYAPDNRMDMAEKIAREADVAIVCIGNHPYGTKRDWFFCPVQSDGREAVDRRSLTLPDEEMIRQVYAANPNTVLVLVSSFPYAINWSDANLPSILQTTHCAQEQGNAVADVIFGYANPAGRTTQTWVSDITHLPPMMDYDIRNGHTYLYNRHKPLYPFGHGLSYTDFDYSDISVRKEGGSLVVKFTLANTGDRDGEEVAQLYLSLDGSSYKLKEFDRIRLKASESREVTFTLPLSEIGPWNEVTRSFEVPAGSKASIRVGASSADTRLTGDIIL